MKYGIANMKKTKLFIVLLTGLSVAPALSIETTTAMELAVAASAVTGAATVLSKRINRKPLAEKALIGIGVSFTGTALVVANFLRNNDSTLWPESDRIDVPAAVPVYLFTATLAALGATCTVGLLSAVANGISYGCGLALAKAGKWFTSRLGGI